MVKWIICELSEIEHKPEVCFLKFCVKLIIPCSFNFINGCFQAEAYMHMQNFLSIVKFLELMCNDIY